MKISYIHDCCETLSRMSRDCRTTVVGLSHDSRKIIFSKLDQILLFYCINIHSMRLQRESCVYIVNLCRELVVIYLRTSLQLLHSSEIGA